MIDDLMKAMGMTPVPTREVTMVELSYLWSSGQVSEELGSVSEEFGSVSEFIAACRAGGVVVNGHRVVVK